MKLSKEWGDETEQQIRNRCSYIEKMMQQDRKKSHTRIESDEVMCVDA
jgi:hypothetical protein